MKENIIDLDKWPRANLFKHFMAEVKCVISLTAEVDITNLLAFCRSNSLKFYPVMLHAVSKTVNQREEFRYGYNSNGDLVCWDVVYPSHIIFHPEDENFTRIISVYHDSCPEFCAQALADMQTYKQTRGLEINYPYRNTFDVSCLPWLNFQAFDLHVFDSGTYLPPVITWGKHVRKGSKYTLTLNLLIHHAVADGFHAARFFSDFDNIVKRL